MRSPARPNTFVTLKDHGTCQEYRDTRVDKVFNSYEPPAAKFDGVPGVGCVRTLAQGSSYPAAQAQGSLAIQAEAWQIVMLANQARASAGAAPLRWDSALPRPHASTVCG